MSHVSIGVKQLIHWAPLRALRSRMSTCAVVSCIGSSLRSSRSKPFNNPNMKRSWSSPGVRHAWARGRGHVGVGVSRRRCGCDHVCVGVRAYGCLLFFLLFTLLGLWMFQLHAAQ